MKAQAVCSELIVFFVKQLKWGDGGFRGAPLQRGKTQVPFFLSGPQDTLDLSWIFMDSGPSKTITFTRDQLKKVKLGIPFR